MSPASSSRSAPPPSHQEVTRKLSVHSAARPIPKVHFFTLNLMTSAATNAPISGTESDSDSVLSPDNYGASPLTTPIGLTHGVGSLSQPPLQAIAERRSASGGEESEEDEEDEEDEETSLQPRGSHDETVLKTGYLWKKGERRKTWKKRWFVLRPVHLAFYKTSAEYKLLRLLELTDIHSCSAVQLKKHQNTFVLVSPTRTFYLQAETAQEVSEWVKAITEARTSLQATSTQSSATAPIPIPRTSSQRHSYQQQRQQQQQQQQQSQHAAPPASPSLSHSPYGHQLTSSESEDASSSVPRPTPKLANATPAAVMDIASPSKQTGPIDTSKVVINGYLMKCGSRRHIWHNRWFVLTGDKLVYSRSHMDTKPHRSIPLAQILDALEYDLPARPAQPGLGALSPPHHSSKEGDEHDGGAGKHTFKIVTTKRTLLVCAPTEEEEVKWLSAVRALIARRSVVPGDSAAIYSPPPHSHSLPAPLPSQNALSNHANTPGTTATTASAIAPGVASSVPLPPTVKIPASGSVSIPSTSEQGGGGVGGHIAFSPPGQGNSNTPGPSPTAPHANLHAVPTPVLTNPSTSTRRRDSFARRLSLNGAGSFLSHPGTSTVVASSTNNTISSGGGGGGGGVVPQEA
ncbi:hypothetical protein BDY19DRAFT_904525 [Irpex rosettiformis]|uniref:Uncharacterized protein n=1 Tax=Irpex rosettiformis TaxID=378272 RepID=A0ACB8U9T8_9APHY|nr:hypothetical protein BDY19DRAFT_904525 [Irpex rosettiformis]